MENFERPGFVIIGEWTEIMRMEEALIEAAGGTISWHLDKWYGLKAVLLMLKEKGLRGIIVPYGYINRKDDRARAIVQFAVDNGIHIIRAHRRIVPEEDWCATVYAYHILHCSDCWWWVYDEDGRP